MKNPNSKNLSFGLLALISIVPVQAATIVAQWNFNDSGNATTAVANVGGFVGTLENTAARTAAGGGRTGAATDFAYTPGTNTGRMNSSTAGFLTALNSTTATQAVSMTYWQNLGATPTSTAFWANSPGATGGNRGLSAHSPWSDGNTYYDTSGCCGAPNRVSGALGATVGKWELMTYIYDNGNKSVYRDTTLITSGTAAAPLFTNIDAFYVGNAANGTEGMNARIDEFTVWRGALTLAEITNLVPEPSAGVMGLLAVLGTTLRRRRSKI